MQSEHHSTSIYIRNSVIIFGIKINIDVDKLSHRKLNELPKSRISLKTLILRNNGKTEFFNVHFKFLCSLYLSTKYHSETVFTSDMKMVIHLK